MDARIFLVLFGLSLLFFARSVGFEFVGFDDTRVLLGHPNLFGEKSLAASVREIFVDYFPREEPLPIRDLSWAVDARLFGFDDPFGYHFGNVVLNALAVGLLYLLLRRTTRSVEASVCVSLCFAVLPVHAEPVCWVMGRKDLLAAVFLLAALLSQSFELECESPKRRRALYTAGLLCVGLGLLSKASALVFFAVLALHRVFHPYLEGGLGPREPIAWARRALRAGLAVAPHAALSVGFFVWYRGVVSAYGIIDADSPGALDPEHLLNVARFAPLILGQYLAHLAWPLDLSMYYRWPHVEIPLSGAELAGSGALALAILLGLAYLLARRRDLAFYALFSLALLLPYVGLFYVGFWSADRYIYLAAAGVLAIAVVGLREIAARSGALATASTLLAVAFIAGSAAVCWRQQSVWRSGETLWLYEAYREEPSLLSIQALAKAYVNRAAHSESERDRETWIARAETEIERGFARHAALGLAPSRYHSPEQLQLARLHYLQGRIAELRGFWGLEPLRHYERAFELAPERLTAIYTSRSLFTLAGATQGDEQRKLVEDSFDYFIHYIEFSRHDPLLLAESRDLLETNYAGRFPYLEDRIVETRRNYFQ